ncbi:MAG: glycoside hydrolase family 3 protein [Ruminococcaceae bacterium]|nr:glycoside hydrolase family 3 protein [Oscillospiraceae bacterium]
MEKYLDKSLSAQERAEDLVSRMTLEEKASQLRYDAPAIERLGVPEFNWWNEALHGIARAGTSTMFPQAIGLAAMFDEVGLHRIAEIISMEGRAKYNTFSAEEDRDIYKGLTFWSPNINIFRDPRWGRGHETYGEDPYLTATLGKSFVEGIQGKGKVLRGAACAKHFAVHSGPEALRHEFDAVCNPKDMNETYLPAFKVLVDAGVEGVMGAYNRVNGEPACASTALMDKLDEWGFDGYFVSDCWAIRDFHTAHMVTANAEESIALALKLGCDCNCGNTYIHMMSAYEKGMVTEEDITKACVHLMRTRIRLGLFDGGTPEFDSISWDCVACKEHVAASLDSARKSMVLLKNNGVLPIDKRKISSIGVIGPNANSIDALRANYFGVAAGYTTILQGIQQECGDDVRVYYAQGSALLADRIEPLARKNDGISEAVICAKNSDVVVLCVGLDATVEGEQGDTGNAFAGGDKIDLLLPEAQRDLMDAVLAVGKPTVVVVLTGSAMNPLADRADALLHAWYPGQEGGKAVADIIFGKVSPSGKLPVTFYETADLLPEFTDYSMKNRTYRYAENNVLYPFGFGLTYSEVSVDRASYRKEGVVTVTVTNKGEYAVDEVVQVYIRSEESEHEVLNTRLCGFKRVSLARGESKKVQIKIAPSAFEVVDNDGRRFVPGGEYSIFAGISQPDELSFRLGKPRCKKLTVNI